MRKQLLSTLAIAAVLTFVGQSANAQVIVGGGLTGGTIGHYSPAPVYGYGSPWGFQRPSYPQFVTPSQVTGVNPWTGGLNTGNMQLNNTYFDYGRNGSQYNGTRRWVNRPVYDSYGRITGHQQGYVWNNSITGQEHGDLNTRTPNGLGGENNTSVAYSNYRPSDSKGGK